ncbi:M50 family metallopeptidase [Fervidibacillus halotolerans]|uniref:M50 family metallopeptidase n=1 Tax=Fervidibacillus halotolerans TaxID=2980027 RepID=A0A9E8RWB7_9BACI|nr:M50 family metallopeptidase [Fervidibacillus halotolerans]WAA11580.1 M50 family metallopeptidase [Fervidibacillus halotolerans]
MNKLFTIIKVMHIHPLFWIIGIIAVFTAHFIDLLMLLFIVFFHEIGHALAAVFFSWKIKRIQLLPFGGVCEFEKGGAHPLKEELVVVLSGPFQHLWMTIGALFLDKLALFSSQTVDLFLQYNLMILLFNLLPIFPLDGGRLIQLSFCYFFPYIVALRRSIFLSFLILLLYSIFLLVFSPFHLNGWLIFCFLLFSLHDEWKKIPFIFVRFLIDRYVDQTRRRMRKKEIYVDNETWIQNVVSHFYREAEHTITVKRNDRQQRLTEKDFLKAYFERHPHQQTVGEVFS